MTVRLLEELNDSPQYGKRRDVVSSSSGKTYRVAFRRSDSRWTCSCPDWINRCNKKGIDCKHVKSVLRQFEGLADKSASLFDSLRSILGVKTSDEAMALWRANKDRFEVLGEYLDLSDDARHPEFLSLFAQVKDHIKALLLS